MQDDMFELALATAPALVKSRGMVKQRSGWTWGLVASAGLTFSCLSGQTGSADCAEPPLSCICESFVSKNLVKATVLEVSNGSATLEIEQVLNPNPQFSEQAVHHLVVGALRTGTACGKGSGELPQAGDTVFAAFTWYGDEATIPADAWVQPWGDTVDLGNGN